MRLITIFIYILISFSVGFFLIGISLNMIDLNLLVKLIENQILGDFNYRLLTGLIGFFIILLCIRFIQSSIVISRRNRSLTFESPHGQVDITLFAIEDMIKKMLEKKSQLTHIKPMVILKKNGIDVIIKSYLASEVNISELTTDIQEKIKDKLQGVLGEDKEIKIKLEIKKLAFSEKQKRSEDELEVPFRNF